MHEIDDTNRHLALLLAQGGAGCERSFQLLHHLTKTKLLSSIYRFVFDRAAAEELLQDTYLKAWRRHAQFDATKGSVEQWLSRIAKNAALDQRRGARRSLRLAHSREDFDLITVLPSAELNPYEHASQRSDARMLMQSLENVNPACQEMIHLAFWSDMSQREIAATTGRPLGTVKSWTRRSLIALRATMERGGSSPT